MTNTAKTILVDADQYYKMMTVKWCYHQTEGCAEKTTNPKMRVPEFLFGKPPSGYEWDHINRDKLDNRKENLRHATRAQQMQNRDKQTGNYTSKYKGVYLDRRSGRFRAHINDPKTGKKISLGSFVNEDDAAVKRNEAAIEYYGEFAVLNIIN